MMTKEQAIEFAKSSAREAIDQAGEYKDAYGSYRDNVADTIKDEGASEHFHAVLDAYDAEYERMTANK